MPEIRNPIQRFFWDNLTRGGLDLVDANHVKSLVKFAKDNAITEGATTPTTVAAEQTVDAFEKTALKDLLDNQQWRSLLTDDGVRQLEDALGIQGANTRHGVGREAPDSVPDGSVRGNSSNMLVRGQVEMRHTVALFNRDYETLKSTIFENPRLAREERSKQVLFLLQDYARVLKDAGGGPDVAKLRRDLLAAFFDKPLASVLGSQDPDDDLLNTAWETVWGTNPESAESTFAVDKGRQWIAYMSMDGGFIPMATKVDEVLAAEGKTPRVAAFEKKSPLNWIVGEQTGNTKPSSSFQESSAIKSTGVDFAAKLLPSESVLGKRTLDPSVDLRVDFYAWGNFVTLNKASGEKLVPMHDETKAALTVSVENVGENLWKPVFKDASGATVDASKVTCVIQDRMGRVKGDGVATGSYSASWWGFCDRTALQGLVTTKYGFPKPSKDVTITRNGKSITFNAAEITSIVGRRLTELFPTTQSGNRFDAEPDQVFLKDGSSLQGKLKTEMDFYRPQTQRSGDTMLLMPQGKGGPTGTLTLEVVGGPARDIPAADVVEIRRTGGSGFGVRTGAAAIKDVLVLKDGTNVEGTLKSKVSFAGATREANGQMVLKSTVDAPIQGDLLFTTSRGEEKRLAVADIHYIAREDENEILADEALAYIIRNKGVFCADSWTGSSVANGTRTIEEINRWDPRDTGAVPSWVPADRTKLVGYKGAVQNPDNVMFFSLGNKGSTYGGLKFWLELDKNGMPINAKVTDGQWDFLWGVEGKPNWDARPTFNPNMPNDLVKELYINSLADPEAVKDILPDNWRSFVRTPAPTPAPATT